MSYLPDDRVTTIVIHYSATAIDGRPITAAEIDKWHRQRGFAEIGYHYFIRRDGMAETGRDLSQPGRFEVGAHAKGNNSSSIGICYEGGVVSADVNKGFDTRTPAQTAAMVRLIRELQERFGPVAVVGHRDMPYASTQCPGFDAGAWWADVNRPPIVAPPVRPDVELPHPKPGIVAAILAALAGAFAIFKWSK
ncbi:N-acetylmuramoyl-L-alanine amidase [uncultured Jannaschia sp.]|uniref:N-acetylmuramoyl-L-alanine amidase n=1 Tax=uncultured Jannaschia sp. TaxID=293347 RepID=UPI0026066A83|nr:N-acetylmuramoyl-L-alanine amidase [uncultured Jannaschia sp.]